MEISKIDNRPEKQKQDDEKSPNFYPRRGEQQQQQQQQQQLASSAAAAAAAAAAGAPKPRLDPRLKKTGLFRTLDFMEKFWKFRDLSSVLPGFWVFWTVLEPFWTPAKEPFHKP